MNSVQVSNVRTVLRDVLMITTSIINQHHHHDVADLDVAVDKELVPSLVHPGPGLYLRYDGRLPVGAIVVCVVPDQDQA